MNADGSVHALAPAKVNLWLEVLGKRSDGYHELDTWMLALELADELGVRADDSGNVALELSGLFASADIPRDENNLVVKAAQAVLTLARERDPAFHRRGLALTLRKHVPSQAGLGGASSDAAAAWWASERALGITLSSEQRSGGLARLGSDCVFFSEANATGFARCQGRGERVEVQTLPARLPLVAILAPSVLSPTPRVYAALTQPLSAPRTLPRVRPLWFDNPVSAARSALHNRLESAALRAVPELVSWRALLDAHAAAHFRLAGSGSCFFGLFDDPDDATRTLDRIVDAAAGLDLRWRGRWVTRPARYGARIL